MAAAGIILIGGAVALTGLGFWLVFDITRGVDRGIDEALGDWPSLHPEMKSTAGEIAVAGEPAVAPTVDRFAQSHIAHDGEHR